MRSTTFIVVLVLGSSCLTSESSEDTTKAPKKNASDKKIAKTDQKVQKWISLFNEKTLEGWKITDFGGQGAVTVEKKQINLDYGSPLTGVTIKKKFPKSNYELSLEAKRVDGTDFFCGLTFPVGKDHCSLILGGWGGTVVGLSNIDGEDASENATNQLMAFKKDRWYKVRIRVTDSDILVWIDDQKIISQDRTNHKISIRPEVDLSTPLGIASFNTMAAIRGLKYRQIK